jgi:hypothetical protein
MNAHIYRQLIFSILAIFVYFIKMWVWTTTDVDIVIRSS